jgi:hypothetical protein
LVRTIVNDAEQIITNQLASTLADSEIGQTTAA